MGGCTDCFARAAFGILTLFTIGVATGGTIALLVIVEVKRLYHASDAFQIGLIVATAVVFLVFIFSVYASCCGGPTARFVLGALFLLLMVVFTAFGALVADFHNDIGNQMEFLWFNTQYEKVVESIEDIFKCQCFNVTECRPKNITVSENMTCLYKIDQFVDAAWVIVFGTAIGVAALLLVGASIAFCYACKKENHDTGPTYGYSRFPGSSYNSAISQV
jgi:hypothetical protein